MNTGRILLVDDESGILQMLELLLHKEGYNHVDSVTTAQAAIHAVKSKPYDLLVLDVMLPDMDGFELCKEIRNCTNAPILFLTARSSDLDKITGLSIGGDDYITKPFNPLEVAARIQAHLRRVKRSMNQTTDSSTFEYENFMLYPNEGRLVVNGENITCPAKEFELLLYFCKNPNRILTAEQLYNQVWDSNFLGDVKTVVMHISRLRKRIEEDMKKPKYIVNIRGLGYKFIPHSTS